MKKIILFGLIVILIIASGCSIKINEECKEAGDIRYAGKVNECSLSYGDYDCICKIYECDNVSCDFQYTESFYLRDRIIK